MISSSRCNQSVMSLDVGMGGVFSFDRKKLHRSKLGGKYATSISTCIFSIYVDIFVIDPFRMLAGARITRVSGTHAVFHNAISRGKFSI